MRNAVADQVFIIHPGEWHCMVGGRIFGPFNSKGAAEAGIKVEQDRAAKRKVGQLDLGLEVAA